MPGDAVNRERDVYICESTVHRGLAEAGLCERGLVPRYYCSIIDIDPKRVLPHLAD
ncbi:hypothetical protein K461DRAFT_277336 [Myriangium duriaei CBS 260.36]|uniref:Uncharacterized protein n=1 Tax=Myriangium duriaei CBS 260.36 TaxID=1168546 RepID=A0A9P4MH11_9PEZI|nr:hypothetical protein K461DRAFT_277336 [Myriangium duriaei CBS 260.36]